MTKSMWNFPVGKKFEVFLNSSVDPDEVVKDPSAWEIIQMRLCV